MKLPLKQAYLFALVLLKGLKRDHVRRGMFACKPGSRSQHDQFMAQFYIMKKAAVSHVPE